MSREGDLNFPENFVFIVCLQEAKNATRHGKDTKKKNRKSAERLREKEKQK